MKDKIFQAMLYSLMMKKKMRIHNQKAQLKRNPSMMRVIAGRVL